MESSSNDEQSSSNDEQSSSNDEQSSSNDLKNILSKNKDIITIPKKKEYKPSDNMSDILNMMDMESKDIVNKSWSKINRSNKITLLENFIENEIVNNELDEKTGNNLKKLLIQSLNGNLLNKQSDVVYDTLQNTITEIKSLKYDSETKTYSLVSGKNDVKVNAKTRSKTNIDKLLNNSKKRR